MARSIQQSNRIEYINKTFAIEDLNQKQIRKVLLEKNKEGINVDAYEGQILNILAKMIKAKSIVEIGTLFGYSTSWFLKALEGGGDLYSIEKSPENHQIATESLSAISTNANLHLMLGDALELLESLETKGPFDLIFIDANKAAYKKYLDWAVKNIAPGGLIIGDNTFLFGHVYGGESEMRVNEKQIKAMQDFNSYLAESEEFESVLIPTPEGMTIGLKK